MSSAVARLRARSRAVQVAWALLGLGAPAACGDIIQVELTFAEPTLAAGPSGGVSVEIPGCVTFNDPGLPLLPAREVVVLLPPGETVRSIRAVTSPPRSIAGRHQVAPAETPRPISLPGPFSETPPDPTVYSRDEAYPPAPARLVTEQLAWGHGLAFLQVRPVAYRPISGELLRHERMTIEVETGPRPGADPLALPNLRRTPAALASLRGLVANPRDLDLYADCRAASARGSRLSRDDYPYVIITSAAFAGAFAEVAAYESSRGLRATVVTLDEIGAYPGADLPAQMRNFVIDAYVNWATEYVLLGGDIEVVPVRNLYVNAGGTIDQFPGDCYFEGLDGNWNADGDEYWGEEGEYDLAGELAVGRVPVSSTDELARWLHKNRMYSESPVVAEVEKGLFVGERLDDYPTWGGNYMDEVKDDCCTHGYCTSGYPDTYLKQTLYDRDGYWSKWQLIDLFNAGFPSSHHLGHSGTTYNMKMDSGDVRHLTNDGVAHSYSFISTQGCYASNFDNPGVDAIAETFLFDEHGAAAFLGNTRYGWYVIGGTGGPSQHYDRQLVDALYGEGIATVGWMNVDSKLDNIWMINPWNLWCHYQLCLLGDPAMPQWARVEGALELAHSGGYVVGQGDYEARVLCDGEPVAGAAVTIWSEDLGVWSSAVSAADGTVTLSPDPVGPMTLNLKALKTDHLPANAEVDVAPAGSPWVVWRATGADDDAAPPSIGDGDGLADLGETLQLEVTLHNVGTVDAANTSLVLTCEDPRLLIVDGEADYGTLPAGATGLNADDLVARVSPAIADGDVVVCRLDIACDGRWVGCDTFTLVLHAAVLTVASWEIDDSARGDGQGDADAGESFDLIVTLANSGSDEGREVHGLLSCADPDLMIEQQEGVATRVPRGGSASFAPPFFARLDPWTPGEGVLHLDLAADTWGGQIFNFAFDIPVASWFEDDLEADLGWRAGLPLDDATAGVWTRVDPAGTYYSQQPVQPEDDHSPLGTRCYVTGQGAPGESPLINDVDGGKTTLLSPILDLTGAIEPRLVYWRWFTNHLGPYPNQDYWQVDISPNAGASWVNLEYTRESLNQWQRMEFAVSDYITPTRRVQVRFIASDYGGESLIEAGVDDFSIETQPDAAGVEAGGADMDGGRAAPAALALRPLAPNPIAPDGRARRDTPLLVRYALPAAGEATLRIFSVDGALVRTVFSGRQAPGEHEAIWDGRDESGRALPGGVYFVRLRAAGEERSRGVVIVR